MENAKEFPKRILLQVFQCLQNNLHFMDKRKSTHATSEATCTVPDSKALGGDVLTPLTLFSLKLLM